MTRFKIPISHDKPIDEAVLLGHDEIVSALKRFLESNDMITPLSIAINGDWGSGKTSVVNTLARQLPDDGFIKVFFEPWRYENSDPPLALISTIINTLNKNSMQKISKNILLLAANTFSSKYLNQDIKDVADFITGKVKGVESFSKELEKVIKNNLEGNQKLIILIDDLDRCDVENTLLILSIMKLFLEIENCICIAAVDFNRLQQAWKAKYQVTDEDDKGKEYLEKIFQIKVSLPKPTSDQVKEFVEELVPDMPDELLALFAEIGPKNPRSIKRIMNLIKFRTQMLNSDFANESSSMWSLLENAITNKNLILAYNGLTRRGGSLGGLIINVNKENVTQYVKMMTDHISKPEPNTAEKLVKFFLLGNKYVKKFNIINVNLDTNFDTLSNLTNEQIE